MDRLNQLNEDIIELFKEQIEAKNNMLRILCSSLEAFASYSNDPDVLMRAKEITKTVYDSLS